MRDALDAPVLRAESEVLPDGRLPDELLVEFSNEGARLRVAELVIAAVGDRSAGVVQGEYGAPACLQGVADAVEGDAGLEVPDARARVAAGEHFDDQVELLTIQRRVRTCAANRPVCGVDGARFRCGHRHQDLRQHVERIRDDRQRLDVAFPHRVRYGGGVEEIARMRGKQRSPAGVADVVAGAPDALHRRSEGRRRLHQHHFVQVADIDSHLQRIGRDDGLQFTILESAFHLRSNLAGQRTVMGIRDRADHVVVQLEGDLLRQSPAVGEEQRRAVRVDHVPEHVGQRIPHLFPVLCGVTRRFGEAHGQFDLLVRRRTHRADLARPVVDVAAADETRDGFDGPHRRGQRDALELAREFHQSFEARREGGAAPVLDDGVNLVEDHRLHGRQGLPSPRGGQQQEQAFRRGDEDFRRPTQQALAFSLGRVAAARRGAHAREGFPPRVEDIAKLPQGVGEIALDVVVQGL